MAKLRLPFRISLLLALLASAQPAPAAIFGKDDRIVVASGLDRSFAPIGRVIGRAGAGTGFLVSACHVLTVKHVFSDQHSAVGQRVEFRAAAGATGKSRRSILRSGGTVVADGAFDGTRDWQDWAGGRSADWMLVRLDSCLGKRLGTVELSPFEPEQTAAIVSAEIAAAGFPADRADADALVVDPSCRIRAWNAREWLHDCSTLPGNSGSPIFIESRSGGQRRLRVIAMVTAGWHWREPTAYSFAHSNRATKIAYLLPIIRRAAAEDMRRSADAVAVIEHNVESSRRRIG